MPKPKLKVCIGRFDIKEQPSFTGVQFALPDGSLVTMQLQGPNGWIRWSGGDLEVEEFPGDASVSNLSTGAHFDIAQ